MNLIFLVFFICFLPSELISNSLISEQNNTYETIVFQPQFRWRDGSCTLQGTGCFMKASNGKVIGMTSAHFINFSGPKLLEVNWLDIRTQKRVATTVQSWGLPGRKGCYEPMDLRSDYLLLLMEGDIYPQSILEMDDRRVLEIG